MLGNSFIVNQHYDVLRGKTVETYAKLNLESSGIKAYQPYYFNQFHSAQFAANRQLFYNYPCSSCYQNCITLVFELFCHIKI